MRNDFIGPIVAIITVLKFYKICKKTNGSEDGLVNCCAIGLTRSAKSSSSNPVFFSAATRSRNTNRVVCRARDGEGLNDVSE